MSDDTRDKTSTDTPQDAASSMKAIFADFKIAKAEFAAEPRVVTASVRTIRQLLSRDARLKEYLRDDDVLDRAIASSRDPEATRAVVRREVHRVMPIVAEVADSLGRELDVQALEGQSVVAQYRILATAGFVEPAVVVTGVPESPTLCDISEALRDKESAAAMSADDRATMRRQVNTAVTLFATRWRTLAGSSYAPGDIPDVAALLQVKAPVPLKPAWSERLSTREAGALGVTESRQAEALAHAPVAHAVVAEGDEVQPGGGEAPNLRPSCDANELLARAGVQPLRPPAAGEPRYTFPGQLLQREHIFYDYAVVVPVDECGPLRPDITAIEQRSLDAANASAAQVIGVLDFLEGFDLASALGTYPTGGGGGPDGVAEELRNLLVDVAAVDHTTSVTDILALKRRIRSMASLVRAAARRRLFIAPLDDIDPKELLPKLAAALGNIPDYRPVQEERIRYGQAGSQMADYLEVNGLRPRAIRKVYDNFCIDNNEQVRTLGPYLFYLGGPFRTILDELVRAASEMREAVDKSNASDKQLLSRFRRLAEGQVNEALMVIGRLLDDIAEQLPLWSQRWAEGSKRLGLLMVYRQYWTPEGYVKGKLVGHKNLMPAQKERLHRRTFVRRLGEDLRVQEFARASEQDYSRTTKETSEIVKESTDRFDFSLSASGGFDILIGSLDVTSTNTVSVGSMSRAAQSSIAEASMKSTMSFNEKREVKLREESSFEQESDSVIDVENPNQEITANYFYYQLLRQYSVTVELHDMRPVLLRTRSVPSEAEVDDKFLADNAHILINVLPAQLSSDLQSGVNRIEGLARGRLRAQTTLDQRSLALHVAENRIVPANEPPEQTREQEARLRSLGEAVATATTALHEAEDVYLLTRTRLDRVVAHVRANICHYMQFIWQASPRTDYDKVLRTEAFQGLPLPQLTRGLMREGYYGDEEIFAFVGPSMALAEALVRTLTPGSDFATLTDEELQDTELFQQLSRLYSEEELDDVLAQMRRQAFVTDPQATDGVLSSRRVQVAQDALVVEALPGQVPLLEGYKMAHRVLDVERACLENHHLAERIGDRAWRNGGEDTYRVYRRDGQTAPAGEEAE